MNFRLCDFKALLGAEEWSGGGLTFSLCWNSRTCDIPTTLELSFPYCGAHVSATDIRNFAQCLCALEPASILLTGFTDTYFHFLPHMPLKWSFDCAQQQFPADIPCTVDASYVMKKCGERLVTADSSWRRPIFEIETTCGLPADVASIVVAYAGHPLVTCYVVVSHPAQDGRLVYSWDKVEDLTSLIAVWEEMHQTCLPHDLVDLEDDEEKTEAENGPIDFL